MTAARAVPELEAGCVLAREIGVLVVLTDAGPVRASYGARMLGAIARDRSRVPDPGEWVTVRRWCDGPVTVESAMARPASQAGPRPRSHPGPRPRLRVAAG